MRAGLLAMLLLATVVAGCFDASTLQRCREDRVDNALDGALTGQTCVDGRLRTYLVTVPEGEGPFPLLLALHGGGGDAENMQRKTHLDDLARQEGIVVLYPQGTPASRGGDIRTWNAMHCCGRAWDAGTDDVAFMDHLIDVAVGTYPIDTTRMGVTGHSNGAMMAHRYGAERSELVCCIMPVAGTIGGVVHPDGEVLRPHDPGSPLKVLIIHATDDPRVPYDGGVGDNVDGSDRFDLSVEDSAAFWETAGSTVQVVTTTGGHGWPGGETDFTSAPAEPDASRLVAEFLLDAG